VRGELPSESGGLGLAAIFRVDLDYARGRGFFRLALDHTLLLISIHARLTNCGLEADCHGSDGKVP
jgi:hypothetical protein